MATPPKLEEDEQDTFRMLQGNTFSRHNPSEDMSNRQRNLRHTIVLGSESITTDKKRKKRKYKTDTDDSVYSNMMSDLRSEKRARFFGMVGRGILILFQGFFLYTWLALKYLGIYGIKLLKLLGKWLILTLRFLFELVDALLELFIFLFPYLLLIAAFIITIISNS